MRPSDRAAKLAHTQAAIAAAQADRDLAARISEPRDLALLDRIVNDISDLASDLASLHARYPLEAAA